MKVWYSKSQFYAEFGFRVGSVASDQVVFNFLVHDNRMSLEAFSDYAYQILKYEID